MFVDESPLLKEELTDPDEFISNSELKALALEVLELVPIPGVAPQS
jgi:hypothetical protein